MSLVNCAVDGRPQTMEEAAEGVPQAVEETVEGVPQAVEVDKVNRVTTQAYSAMYAGSGGIISINAPDAGARELRVVPEGILVYPNSMFARSNLIFL